MEYEAVLQVDSLVHQNTRGLSKSYVRAIIKYSVWQRMYFKLRHIGMTQHLL